MYNKMDNYTYLCIQLLCVRTICFIYYNNSTKTNEHQGYSS